MHHRIVARLRSIRQDLARQRSRNHPRRLPRRWLHLAGLLLSSAAILRWFVSKVLKVGSWVFARRMARRRRRALAAASTSSRDGNSDAMRIDGDPPFWAE